MKINEFNKLKMNNLKTLLIVIGLALAMNSLALYAKCALIRDRQLADKSLREERDNILKSGNEANLQMRPLWQLMHTLPMYRDCPRMDLTLSESLAARVINVPSSAFLVNEDD